MTPSRRQPPAACQFRRRAAIRSSVPASSFLRCAKGRRQSRPGRSPGSDWPAPVAGRGWYLACFETCFSSLVTFSCLRVPGESDRIVTSGELAGECFMTVPTCLIKCFGPQLPLVQRLFCRKLRLDGNTGRGDKAAHENVFRHLWHLHYWLASRWSGRFRLIFLLEWTNAPASRLEPDLRLGAGLAPNMFERSNRPGRHECLTHRRACASTTR